MSNTLAVLKESVKDALSGLGFTVYDTVPERAQPPLAIVQPNPGGYISIAGEEEKTFCETHVVSLQVTLAVGKGTNKKASEDIDELIVKAVLALSDWTVTDVTAPQLMTIANTNSQIMMSVLFIEINTNLEDFE